MKKVEFKAEYVQPKIMVVNVKLQNHLLIDSAESEDDPMD